MFFYTLHNLVCGNCITICIIANVYYSYIKCNVVFQAFKFFFICYYSYIKLIPDVWTTIFYCFKNSIIRYYSWFNLVRSFIIFDR